MNSKILPKQWIYAVLLMAAAGFFIGTIFDLPINKALYSPESSWALFLRSYGQAPVYWCLIVSGLLMMFRIRLQGIWHNLLLLAAGAAITAFAVIHPFQYALELRFTEPYMIWALSFIIFLLPSLTCLFLVWNAPNKQLIWLVVFFLIVSAGSFLLVTVIKEIFRRPRYIALLREPGLTFQPWWLFSRKNLMLSQQVLQDPDLFRSFPSGHTAAAACSFCFCILPLYCHSLSKSRNILFLGALIFTALVGFSRIVLGHHFLSDVCGGFLITFLLFWVTYNFVILKVRQQTNNQ